MATICEYESAIKDARNALEQRSYADALSAFERAWATLLIIPDSELQTEKLTMPRASLEKAIEYTRRQAQSAGQLTGFPGQSIRSVDVVYRRG